MTEEIFNFILYFFFYSFLGYVAEVTLSSIIEKKLTNRGFLFGPLIPIYGFGMLLVLFTTAPVRDNFSLTFFVSILVCSLLEYFTSWGLEKLFHIRWWDYSKTDKYNLNGRICLRNCLAFGIAGSLITYQVHPLLVSSVALIPSLIKILLAIILLVIFLLDTIASNYAVIKARKTFDFSRFVGDQTTEIKRAARKIMKELFRQTRRLERKLERRRKKLQKKLEKKKRKLERKLKKK